MESQAVADLGGDAFVLMARAGQSAWRTALRHWPQIRRILVVCGPGNNGGDGYVMALRALESGLDVQVLRLPEHEPATGLARRACDDYLQAGGRVTIFGDRLPQADLIVDAMFGIGFSRELDSAVAVLTRSIAAADVPVLALDVPTGVDAERGHVSPAAVRADVTVQFLAAHPGLYTGAALEYAGVAEIADLDVREELLAAAPVAAFRLDAKALQGRFPPRGRNSHKGLSGHVLCVGGDHGKGGALLMAAEAGLRCGAGLMTAATRAPHVSALIGRRPEVMAAAVEDGAQLRSLLEAANAVACGPGLGLGEWSQDLYTEVISCPKPRVLDADALNLLASRHDELGDDSILTPHPGEAARLLGTTTAEVQADRFASLEALVDRYRCVVVLKGAGTLISAPGKTPTVLAAGNPGMAVGGMGDVLTGCIAALLAQGFEPFEAATTGALLHSVAADMAAARNGERGLLPSDLFEHTRILVNQ